MVSGCFVSVSVGFPFTNRASLLTCAQKRHPWKRHTMQSAPPNHAAVAQGAVKNARAAPARAASALSERRLRTVNIPLDRVPSPRVKRVEMRAASGLENDTADPCWVLKSGSFGMRVCVSFDVYCVLPVLTAELLQARVVQRVSGHVVHDESPATPKLTGRRLWSGERVNNTLEITTICKLACSDVFGFLVLVNNTPICMSQNGTTISTQFQFHATHVDFSLSCRSQLESRDMHKKT